MPSPTPPAQPAEPARPIEPRLAALLEKQAIRELVQDYSRAVDRQDFARLLSLYTEDGIDDHAGLYTGPAAGFVDWLRGALADVDLTSHEVHQVAIALADDGVHAQGEVYVTAYNRLRGEDGALQDFTQGLRYLDRYRRDAGRWRFAHRTVVCDWARLEPAIWDPAHPLLAGKRFGVSGAADPSYRALDARAFGRDAAGDAAGPQDEDER